MSKAEGRTATAEGALRAEPLALGQALGLLSDAAQVVGGRAAVAAQQAAALVAQAAVVRIAICLHSDLLALAQQSDSSQMCILQCMARHASLRDFEGSACPNVIQSCVNSNPLCQPAAPCNGFCGHLYVQYTIA